MRGKVQRSAAAVAPIEEESDDELGGSFRRRAEIRILKAMRPAEVLNPTTNKQMYRNFRTMRRREIIDDMIRRRGGSRRRALRLAKLAALAGLGLAAYKSKDNVKKLKNEYENRSEQREYDEANEFRKKQTPEDRFLMNDMIGFMSQTGSTKLLDFAKYESAKVQGSREVKMYLKPMYKRNWQAAKARHRALMRRFIENYMEGKSWAPKLTMEQYLRQSEVNPSFKNREGKQAFNVTDFELKNTDLRNMFDNMKRRIVPPDFVRPPTSSDHYSHRNFNNYELGDLDAPDV